MKITLAIALLLTSVTASQSVSVNNLPESLTTAVSHHKRPIVGDAAQDAAAARAATEKAAKER